MPMVRAYLGKEKWKKAPLPLLQTGLIWIMKAEKYRLKARWPDGLCQTK